MFNLAKHKVFLIQILKDIYTDPMLRTVLGFKGGTAALLFYDLPRFSVDLDFDLLDEGKKEQVFQRIEALLAQHGSLYESIEKQNTLFFLVSYQKGERTIKVEISKRKGSSAYELKNYLGIPMLVIKPEDMAAGKLAALLTRKRFAMRDIYDLCFFLKNNWRFNENVVQEKTGLSLVDALGKAIELLHNPPKNQIMHGLGDLLDQKQKAWVKEKMQEETVFSLRLYQESMVK